MEVTRVRVGGTSCEELSADAAAYTTSLPLAASPVLWGALLPNEFDIAKSILPHNDAVTTRAAATIIAILRRRK